ncbi:MAG: NUDIX domain-containing protein [Gammaproteobacteria bacterium]|nr:NUDIX domain-containing protein [Gammaproteobacteria bacterium]
MVDPRPYRLSSGAVVVRHTVDGYVFLMLRAFNHWDFPKGIVEEGESPLEGAVREIEEETTIADVEFPWGEEYVETGPYNRDKVARYYIARTQQAVVDLPVNEDLGRPEHSEYRWVDLYAARELAAPRVRDVLDWAARLIGVV